MYHQSQFEIPHESVFQQEGMPTAVQMRPLLRLVPELSSDEQSDVLFSDSDADSNAEGYRAFSDHHASFPATLQGYLDSMVVQAGCEIEVSGQIPIVTKLEERVADGEERLALVYDWDSPTVGTLYERGRTALLGQDRFTAYEDDDERITKIAAIRLVEGGHGSTQTFATETSLYYAYITGLKALGEPYVLVNDMRCHVVTASELDCGEVVAYGSAQLKLANESRLAASKATMEEVGIYESDVYVIDSEKVLQCSPLSGFMVNQAFEGKTPETEVDQPLAKVIQIEELRDRRIAYAQANIDAIVRQ